MSSQRRKQNRCRASVSFYLRCRTNQKAILKIQDWTSVISMNIPNRTSVKNWKYDVELTSNSFDNAPSNHTKLYPGSTLYFFTPTLFYAGSTAVLFTLAKRDKPALSQNATLLEDTPSKKKRVDDPRRNQKFARIFIAGDIHFEKYFDTMGISGWDIFENQLCVESGNLPFGPT